MVSHVDVTASHYSTHGVVIVVVVVVVVVVEATRKCAAVRSSGGEGAVALPRRSKKVTGGER